MAYQQTLPNGTVLIEEFRILGHLGSGGFANTYLATDLTLGREVAIKEYFPSELAIRADTERVEVKSESHGAQFEWALGRFVREAKTLAKFRHPSVVRVFRVFNANATAYIVLEFVRGSNMEAWIKNLGRPPTQAELDEMLPPLLDALEVVHGAGILHRDIKPANIYIRAADHTPVLLDFGAARYAAGDYAGTTAAIVSKGYSPHEAYATDSRLQGPWTDIYGLAATIYRALSGSAPPESTMRVLEDNCVAAVDLDLPESGAYREQFLEAIDWALQVMPKQRPQSIAEWRYRLLPSTVALPKLRDANGEPTTIQEWNPISDRQADATTFDPPGGSGKPGATRPTSVGQPSGGSRPQPGVAAASRAATASVPAPQGASRQSVIVGVSTSASGAVKPRSTTASGSIGTPSQMSPRSAGASVVNRQSPPVGNRTFLIGLALFAAGGIALLGQWFVTRKPTPVQIAAPAAPAGPFEARDTYIADRNRQEREAASEQTRRDREAAVAAEQARQDREAAAAQARRDREAAAAAEQARKDREAAAAEQARKDREAAAAEQARKDREAAAAEKLRREREAVAAEQARKDREAAAAERVRKEREAAAAEQARKDREAAAAAEQARRDRELAEARRIEDQRKGGVELAAANISTDRKERELGSLTGAPDAEERKRRTGYLKEMQQALQTSKCYDGALTGDVDATRSALASFEQKYRGDVVKIDVASASSNEFERWLGWFWRQESFSCYEKPAEKNIDAGAARRREREAEEAREQRRRERAEEEARQSRRREREEKPRKVERAEPKPKPVYKAPAQVYRAPRSNSGGGGGGSSSGGGGGGNDLLRGGR